MRNILNFKIFESYKSKLFTTILDKCNKEDREGLMKYMEVICNCLDFPVSELDESLFQYLSYSKAIELPPSEKEGFKWLKFWFKSDGTWLDTTLVKTYISSGVSQDINDYNVVEDINKTQKNIVDYIIDLPNGTYISLQPANQGFSFRFDEPFLFGRLFKYKDSENIICYLIQDHFGNRIPIGNDRSWENYGGKSRMILHREISTQQSRQGETGLDLDEVYFNYRSPILVLKPKYQNEKLKTEENSIRLVSWKDYSGDLDKIFDESCYAVSPFRGSDYALVLDLSKLIEKSKNIKKSDVVDTRKNIAQQSPFLTYTQKGVEPLSDETIRKINQKKRVDILTSRIEFVPTTERIQELIDRCVGGKDMLYFLMSNDLSFYLYTMVDLLRKIFENKEKFLKIEAMYKRIESNNYTSEDITGLDSFYKENEKNINDLTENFKKVIPAIKTRTIELNKNKSQILNQKSNQLSREWSWEDIDAIVSSDRDFITPRRRAKMKFIMKYLDSLTKTIYDRLSPLKTPIYTESYSGLLDDWNDRRKLMKAVIDKENKISLREICWAMFSTVATADFEKFLNNEYPYISNIGLDSIEEDKLPGIFKRIENKMKKV